MFLVHNKRLSNVEYVTCSVRLVIEVRLFDDGFILNPLRALLFIDAISPGHGRHACVNEEPFHYL